MQSIEHVKTILGDTLGLGGRTPALDAGTPLIGHFPELDSMAVVSIIAALEEHFGIMFDDDEINTDTFKTVGSLSALVDARLALA